VHCIHLGIAFRCLRTALIAKIFRLLLFDDLHAVCLLPVSIHLLSYIGVPEVLLHFPHVVLSKLLLCILRAHTGRYNDILTSSPVDRGRNTLLVRELQSINDSQYLACVPSRTCRIRHCQANLLVGVNDEDRSDRERDTAVLGQVV
jgi:hypothetical protein